MRTAGVANRGRRTGLADAIAGFVHWAARRWSTRLLVVGALTVASIVGSSLLMPPADYLPVGSRNLVFGLIVPPPGTGVEQQRALGKRVEAVMRPYFEAGSHEPGSKEYGDAAADLPPIPTFDFATMSLGIFARSGRSMWRRCG